MDEKYLQVATNYNYLKRQLLRLIQSLSLLKNTTALRNNALTVNSNNNNN
jgi:hypothetical protein